jgi:hypothetical protein
MLIDRREHSGVLDVQSLRGVDCNTDHNLVVAKVRKRLALSKQTQISHGEVHSQEIKCGCG